MKVMQVFKDFYPPVRGGIEQHIHDVVYSMDGFRFTVLTSSRELSSRTEYRDGVEVIRAAEILRIASTPIVPGWISSLRKTDADVLHFHMPNPFAEVAMLAAGTRLPAVATYHADVTRPRMLTVPYRWLQQRFLQRVRRIIVSSPSLASISLLSPHRDRIEIVPFGVDGDTLRCGRDEIEAIRRRHRPPIVLFFGRLVHYKGIEVLIDAMRYVDASLVVCGDGPLRAALERLAFRAVLPRAPVFVGEVDDEERPAYLAAADVFVLPSTSLAEGFGIAMLEAMAVGTPVISTELGTGTSWLNLHGETGLVVHPGRASELARALQILLKDDAVRQRMGRAARRRALDRFPKTKMLEELAAIYRSL